MAADRKSASVRTIDVLAHSSWGEKFRWIMQNLLLLVSAYRAVTDDWSGLLRAADPPATQCVWPMKNQSLVGSSVAHRSTCFQARERITPANEVAGQNHTGK